MILIVTNSRDATADLVQAEFDRRGIPYCRLNTEEFPQQITGRATFSSGRSLLEIEDSNQHVCVRNTDIRAVWYRRPVPPRVSSSVPNAAMKRFATDEAQEFLRGFWYSLDCYWLSHPEAIRIAERKLVQLSVASQMGIRIPRTVVTNDPDAILELRTCCPGGLVVKPLYVGFVDDASSPLYVYTTFLDDEDYERIAAAALTPSIYQEAITRVADIRVTVVGDRVFAARIEAPRADGDLCDWRCFPLSDLRHFVHQLPDAIRGFCLALVRKLRLEFGAIDFVLDEYGEYVFLEINANGQWGWIEKLLELPITGAIVDQLTQKAHVP